MKVAVTPVSWIPDSQFRLHASPFVTGAVATRRLLERLPSDKLASLTSGYAGGIFTPPIHNFRRNYVSSREHGVPFLGSTTMLRADLDDVALLAKRDAFSSKYRMLRLERGMTLISCSGTIGRVVYVRGDMDGMWSSGDVLKVSPDSSRVPPGFLFAFLSSRYGIPLLTSGTYGSIIQHIEAYHIADLPVPRFSDGTEGQAAELVDRAAESRTRALELLDAGRAEITDKFKVEETQDGSKSNSVGALRLRDRMDAYYYSRPCVAARNRFDSAGEQVELGSVARVFIPGIFKRKYAPDPRYGYPYITGVDVFQTAATSQRFLQREVAEKHELVVRKGMILVQEAGQLGGLIGRSVLVGNHLDGFAVTNNMVRLRPFDDADAGYLYAVLSTPEGVRLIARESAGSSIPHIDTRRVRRLQVPWLAQEIRKSVSRKVAEAIALRDEACNAEDQARALVEAAIGEAS